MPAASMVTLASGLRLSWAAVGDPSGAVVVLLPGPTDSWRSYEPVLKQLPSSIRAIAVSPRGHGDSDKPSTGYRIEDFAEDVIPLLDGLGVERAVVAGHSGSCLVARKVAVDHPERIAGLVLEASPTTLRGHAGLAEFVGSVVASVRDPIDPAFARSLVTDTASEHVAPELLDRFASEVMKVPAHVWKEMFTALMDYNDLAELHRICAPTLLVWGDADQIVDRAMQTLLADRLRAAELLIYPGVGHTPRWENPIRFANDLATFVHRLPQRS